MTEVSFHFNVPDRAAYACRLVRKATRSGADVVVSGLASDLSRFDRTLWSFEPLEFLPHALLRAGEPVTPRHRMAPVWLIEDPSNVERHDVLVNLGDDAPPGFESFARVIEIVSSADADRLAARARWKYYAARGYTIAKQEVQA